VVKLISRLGLLLGALGLPVAALAAGLGKLTVHSALGDPLQAEIEIVSVRSDELASLQARIAPPSAYKQANIDYQPGLASVRAKIETRAGRPVVVLTSTQPITDPFLNVLVELTWTTGAVTREYTFLLDPPAYAAPRPAVPEVKEVRPQEAPPQPAPPSQAAPAPSPGPAATVVAAAPAEPTPETYGPVRRGETLSQIAERTRYPGASLEQMLVALFRSNPDAFMDNNMNRLKAGPILRVPNREETMAIDQKEAVAEFRAQVASWKAYRDQLAAAAATVESPAGEGQAAAGQVTVAVEEKVQAEPPKEVLKLSKAEAGPAPAGQSLQERIRALEEENIAKEKALKEAQERVALLEKNIQDMQKLLELKGQPLVPTAPEAAKTDAAQAKPEPVGQAGGVAPQPKVKPETAPAAPAQAAPSTAPAPEQPRQQAAPKPAPPPPAEPSLMETLLGEPLYLAGAGGVVVLLLGWGLYASRRRQAAGAAPEETLAEPGIGSAPAAVASQEAAVPLSAESTAAGPGTLDEVDPLQEAEVYLTYRRDAQAEEVLKEAIAKTPKRPELYLKLLEVYSMRQDKTQFEETARRLQAIAPGTPHWEKAVTMGLALDPTNPLYGGTPAPAASAAGLDTVAPATERSQGMDVDFDLGGKPQAETPPPRPTLSAERASAGLDTSTVDFEITSGVTAGHHKEMKAARDVDESLSVSFDLSGLEQSRTEDRPAGPQESTATKLDFDFSLDLGEPAQETPGGAKDSHWQEVATKFDLAKAYKEMGDKEGAREILQEVLREGDEQQRRDAQALLETL
jgi:pilus assembly protein FimV